MKASLDHKTELLQTKIMEHDIRQSEKQNLEMDSRVISQDCETLGKQNQLLGES